MRNIVLFVRIFNLLHEVKILEHIIIIVGVKAIWVLPLCLTLKSTLVTGGFRVLHILFSLQKGFLLKVEVINVIGSHIHYLDIMFHLELIEEGPVHLKVCVIVLKQVESISNNQWVPWLQ